MPDFQAFVENKVNIGEQPFTAIIGERPSAGAKSPILWNAVFAETGIDCEMIPLDVTYKNLPRLMACLKNNASYLGGAVALPYKGAIMETLDAAESEAGKIGAVNCLYRNSSKLVGTNTDGTGAIAPLVQIFGERLVEMTVLLMGTGGAGLAVATYLEPLVSKLILHNRTASKAVALADVLSSRKVEISESCSCSPDILINCTSVGHAPLEGQTAFGDEAYDILKSMKRLQLVYEIIYQPKITRLLSLAQDCGIETLNGEQMNLEQAVIAFKKVMGSGLSLDEIRRRMKDAAS
jgi:shikimate dehydrogenase